MPLALEYGDTDYDTANVESRTWSGRTFPSPSAGRYAVICLSFRQTSASATPPVVTIQTTGGAISCTAVAHTANGTSAVCTSIYVSDSALPSGTSAEIVITSTGNAMTRHFWSLHALVGASSSTPVSTRSSDGTPASLTLSYNFTSDKASDEVEIVCAHGSTSSAQPTLSSSGNLSALMSSVDQEFGAFRAWDVTASGSCTVTSTVGAGNAGLDVCTAKFG